jgi:hypothetical protein
MGNLHRPIHTWLAEEISPEPYADDVFLSDWWRRIGSEVWILEYSSSSAAIFSFSRNRASLRTAGMFLSEMNDHVSQFESDVTILSSQKEFNCERIIIEAYFCE